MTMNSNSLKDISVLYVEDEAEIREVLAKILKRRIGTVYTASNGFEGVEKFRELDPDIVITDINMPKMDGLKMIAAIRKIKEDVPVIIITGHNEPDYFVRSIELGIDRYVLKPTDSKMLIDAIKKSATHLLQRREIETESRYIKFILDSCPFYMITTRKGKIEYINKRLLDFLGHTSVEEFKDHYKEIGDFFDDIIRGTQDDKANRLLTSHVIEKPACYNIVKLFSKTSKTVPDKFYMVSCNAFPELESYLYSFIDVTGLEKERKDFEFQAMTDSLTGIYNRAKFSSALLSEITRIKRYPTPLSLIMLDIDHFKKINDTYGHSIGDQVLKDVSAVVTMTVREQDLFARWGGEEFMMLAIQSDLNGTKKMAEKVRKAIEANHFQDVDTVTCSFGVTEFQKDDSIDSFIRRVDKALYRAKNEGRNRVEVL